MKNLTRIASREINYQNDGRWVAIRSPYWEAKHDRTRGGALASLVFKHGSKKNILVSPMTSYIRRKEGKGYPRYEEILSSKTRLSVSEKDGDIVVASSGNYVSEEGVRLPVMFRRQTVYSRHGLVRVSLELRFLKRVDAIYELGIASFRLARAINTIGFRASADTDLPSYPTCQWHEFPQGELSYMDAEPVNSRYIPFYFCAVNRGVEGLELFCNDDAAVFNRAFTGKSGLSYFGVIPSADDLWVRIEPSANWDDPIAVNPGAHTFNYYLGLPFSKGLRTVTKPYYCVYTDHHWPDNQTLDLLADSGIKVIKLHNDYDYQGDTENFWHDGFYPPYDPDNMKKMDETIEAIHRRGMKVVPYFSVKELHPICPEYKRHVDAWKRCTDRKLTVLHNYIMSGEWGAQMCLRSGWLNFKKKTIDQVLSNHAFDGIYYDGCSPLPCCNPVHGKGSFHLDIDELLDLLFWTRRRVGPQGFIYLHLSGVPFMVAENLADLVITNENYLHIMPRPGNRHPQSDFAGIVGHVSCRMRSFSEPEKERKYALGCLLEGLIPEPGLTLELGRKPGNPVLEEIKKISRYDLTTFKFERAGDNPVIIEGEQIYAALYWNRNSVLLHFANLGLKPLTFQWRLDLACRGWPKQASLSVEDGTKSILVSRLLSQGLQGKLAPLTSQCIRVNRCV